MVGSRGVRGLGDGGVQGVCRWVGVVGSGGGRGLGSGGV